MQSNTAPHSNKPASERQLAGASRLNIIALAGLLLLLLALYFDTFTSISDIWFRSDTFLHGVLIFPISVFLIYRLRGELRNTEISTFWPALIAILLISLGWSLSTLLGVQAGSQMAVIAIIPFMVWTMLGTPAMKLLSFPLAYLVFAVPFGEFLIPALIEFTAFFTVEALNLTGIPVLRDGQYFSTPNGNFEVAKACSGIRYLLAALALGTLYAYLSFRNLRKRLAFIAFSLFFPIIANGVRAYVIVLIAHFSDMQLAVGVDHIIFGWIFFGLVVALMFFVGNRFADGDEDYSPDGRGVRHTVQEKSQSDLIVLLLGLAAALTLAVGPWMKWQLTSRDTGISVAAPASIIGWQATTMDKSEWFPQFANPGSEASRSFTNEMSKVELVLIQYRSSSQGAELASSESHIFDPLNWTVGARQVVPVELSGPGTSFDAMAVTGEKEGERRLVWYWYDVRGRKVTDKWNIKLHEARDLLRGRTPVSTLIAISTTAAESPNDAANVLREFLTASYSAIDGCIRGRGAAECRPAGGTESAN